MPPVIIQPTSPLLAEIDAHLTRTALSPSRFGRMVMRDPRFVFDVRSGRVPGTALERRLRQYFAEVARLRAAANENCANEN